MATMVCFLFQSRHYWTGTELRGLLATAMSPRQHHPPDPSVEKLNRI